MVLQMIWCAAGVFLMGNGIILMAVTNFNFGMAATAALGLVFLLYGIFRKKLLAASGRGVWKAVRYLAYAGLLGMLGVLFFVAAYGQIDNVTYREDALIVLGSGVQGERVTLPLAHRLDEAIAYSEKNPDALLLVTGGQGPQEDITEALAMERYLLERGVAQHRIVKEERATSTNENFKYAKQILDNTFTERYTTAFVTNGFHVYRADRLSKLNGLNSNHLHAGLEWYSVSVNYVREFFAVLKLWILKS